jgi:hypothetical protein
MPLFVGLMSEPIIYPRSPRETMAGWVYLPRYVDKIRLHLAGKLHPDYRENLGKGFDGLWLKVAGTTHEQMVEVVKHSAIDGQVCDWVRANVKTSVADQDSHRDHVLNHPRATDQTAVARLQTRKEESGLGARMELNTFIDYIDADEKRL